MRAGTRRVAAAVLAGVVGSGVVGCTGGDGTQRTVAPTPEATADGEAVRLPDDAAGRQAAWVLDVLGPDGEATTSQVRERFADVFLDEVPAEELLHVLAQLREQGPWTVTSADGGPGGVVVRLAGTTGDLDMQLAVDADERITGLLFTPAAPPRDRSSSWDELADEVDSLPGDTSLYVARVEGGECVPLDGLPAGTAAGESLPIGSIVKLYVLGAVVTAVASGDLAWDTELALTDDLRSLPSGRLQDEPAGTVVTVEDAARDMIAISDNTATDLLVDAVGRDAVEDALGALGHADPDVNVPFPTTRDLFQIGWGGGEDLRTRWRDADDAGRRALLDGLPGGDVQVDVGDVAAVAVWPYGVDWFATAADLCTAHVALAALAVGAAGEPVREILAANPGVTVDDDAWSHVAFKGGSSTGTMAGAWYAEPAGGGSPVVVVVQSAARSAQDALPPATMVGIAEDALALAR